ncbi:putative nucleic acid-binding protein [Catalinimonas alkaloidigena]|uniref:PIN domain-containing protein n=1 Tax=Catalinimonas alkaloidigena TaxID=1075417 RepID=UPI002405919F|nr:PIN domain-containing protein [Catalinimonas alkaloidigena]MDF9795024.1 putative nucleic acid-binding protein [Catalinimonas alkaloidigena]
MNSYVSDTMALILRLEERKMPKKVKHIFEQTENALAKIYIPSIVFSELAYLAEKGRIETSLKEAEHYLNTYPSFQDLPLTFSLVQSAFTIDDIPELHDRLISGGGKMLNIPIITNDPDMQKSIHVQALWK